MKIIVHIGTSKTGTSTVQQTLNRNRKHLNSLGYHYLRSMGVRSHAAFPRCFFSMPSVEDPYFKKLGIHTDVAIADHNKRKLRAFEREIKGLPSNIHTVITSCEHFYGRFQDRAEIESFHGYLKMHFDQVEAVVYLRSQAEVVASLYSTALRTSGLQKELSDFARKHCHAGNPYYNYFDGLSRWRQVFGPSALSVRLFDKMEFVGGDLILDFFSRIDSNIIAGLSIPDRNLNESINHIGQILARIANAAAPRFIEGVGSNEVNTKLIRRIFSDFKGKGEVLPDVEFDRITEEFHVSNSLILKTYFPGRSELFQSTRQTLINNGRMLTEEQEATIFNIFEYLMLNRKDMPNEGLPSNSAEIVRDAAIALEGGDLNRSIQLMKIAHVLRPSGEFIKNKLMIYEDRLAVDKLDTAG